MEEDIVKISEMAETEKINDDDIMQLVQAGFNKKTKIKTLKKFIQPKAIQKKISNVTIRESGYLYFDLDDYTDEDIVDLITFDKYGLITFNCNAKIKVTINLWLTSAGKTARPWVALKDYANNKNLANAINDNSSGYVTLEISNYYKKIKRGQQLGVYLTVNEATTLNQSSGDHDSYMNIEILEQLEDLEEVQ